MGPHAGLGMLWIQKNRMGQTAWFLPKTSPNDGYNKVDIPKL